MKQEIFSLGIALCYAIIAARLLYPILIKLSIRFKYTDAPNNRKLHKVPVPVVGGIGIILTLAVASVLLPGVQEFVMANKALSFSLAALGGIGMVDDKMNLSARLRLIAQVLCSFAVAYGGTRISSLHGFLGIKAIPVGVQYMLTVILITGITNAINLLDGIDGLAGLLALINLVVLSAISLFLHEYGLATLLIAAIGALVVFLKYNWRPAKIFMGDSGSLFLGFLMSVAGIYLVERSASNIAYTTARDIIPIMLLACFAIPVIDAIRVFAGRMQKGKSPFSADKTHLHHKLIKHFMVHNSATKRIITLHVIIILCSFLLKEWLSISMIAVLILSLVFSYSFFLDFAQNFSVWYRKIKRFESNE